MRSKLPAEPVYANLYVCKLCGHRSWHVRKPRRCIVPGCKGGVKKDG